MSDLRKWAALDGDTVVHGGFDAPQEYIDEYESRVVDPEHVTTPPWYHDGIEFVDVTDIEPRPVEGWKRSSQGKWIAPPEPEVPEPTAEELQRAEDNEFIRATAARIRAGESVDQADRDRLMALQLERTLG